MKDVGGVKCFCGSGASLKPNSVIYNGRSYGNVPFAYVCDRFPACRGSVGVHPDGRPLGTIPDQETKRLRMAVHAVVDPLWKESANGRSKKRNRGSVYGWLRRILEMDRERCHVGMFTKEDCLLALDRIKKNPYRRSGEEAKAEEIIK